MLDSEILERIRLLTAKERALLQRRLLESTTFSQHVRDLLGFHMAPEHIVGLWASGMMRADYLESQTRIRRKGIVPIQDSNRDWVDQRLVRTRQRGWGSAISSARRPAGVSPYFHPYRLMVLYHLARASTVEMTSIQYLLYAPGVLSVAERILRLKDKSTGKRSFSDAMERWNGITELCIALEPFSLPIIHQRVVSQWPQNLDEAREMAVKRLDSVAQPLDALGLPLLEKLREELVQTAEMIEPNRRLHTVVRLMKAEERTRLKGNIGLAYLIQEMAEVIRRASERHFGCSLFEEDEIGFGTWMRGARRMFYGTNRVFDGNKTASRTFFHQMGLDAGLRVRCYVEGATELAALRGLIGTDNRFDIIDLRGNVVARRNKGLAFRDSLRSNSLHQIFSFVFIDGDRSDYLRAVRKAADDDEMVGAFFISSPDFELANFSTEELRQILLELDLAPEEADAVSRLDGSQSYSSAKEIFEELTTYLGYELPISKGSRWGEILMDFALRNPTSEGDGGERPIVVAARMVLRAVEYHFQASFEKSRIDPTSGQPIPRA